MGSALQAFDFYDLMEDRPASKGADCPPLSFFVITENIDVSLNEQGYKDDSAAYVYTHNRTHGRITIMSAFRKDLFVSITLPVLGLGVLMFGAIGGSFLYTNSSFLRLDDHSRALQASISEVTKAQAVTAEQTSAMVRAQEATNSKLDKVIDQLGSVSSGLEVLKSQRSNPPS
ncbi:hypothetical protein RYA60_18525 [Pseudomonas syringae]|nr:hypothetical protein [Pseudomonas syringae]